MEEGSEGYTTNVTCDRREKFCTAKEKLWQETETGIACVSLDPVKVEGRGKKVTLMKRLFQRYNLDLCVPIAGVINIGSGDTEVRRS